MWAPSADLTYHWAPHINHVMNSRGVLLGCSGGKPSGLGQKRYNASANVMVVLEHLQKLALAASNEALVMRIYCSISQEQNQDSTLNVLQKKFPPLYWLFEESVLTWKQNPAEKASSTILSRYFKKFWTCYPEQVQVKSRKDKRKKFVYIWYFGDINIVVRYRWWALKYLLQGSLPKAGK